MNLYFLCNLLLTLKPSRHLESLLCRQLSLPRPSSSTVQFAEGADLRLRSRHLPGIMNSWWSFRLRNGCLFWYVHFRNSLEIRKPLQILGGPDSVWSLTWQAAKCISHWPRKSFGCREERAPPPCLHSTHSTAQKWLKDMQMKAKKQT